jgi:ABC-2 type transport system ATP-binding protein
VSLTCENPAVLREGLQRLPGVSGVEIDTQDGRLTVFPKSGAALFEAVSDFLRAQKVAFSELQWEQGRLDEVFRQITTAPAQREGARA